jgi:hypothetical protein
MDPHSKKRRPLETLGIGDPSDNTDTKPGVSGNGTFQQNQGSSNPSGDMPIDGGTLTTRGRPGWSSSPPGKEFEKDSERVEKTRPVEGLDDNNVHNTNSQGGLVKQIPVTIGGVNPTFDKLGAKRK